MSLQSLIIELDSPKEAFLSDTTIFFVYEEEKLSTLEKFKEEFEQENPEDFNVIIVKGEKNYSIELKSSKFSPLVINDVNILYISEIRKSHYTDATHFIGFWIYGHKDKKGKEISEYKEKIDVPIVSLNILDGDEPKFVQ